MNLKNGMESVKKFFERMGKRNLIIAGAVTLIIAAVAVNWIVFSGDEGKDGFDYGCQFEGLTGKEEDRLLQAIFQIQRRALQSRRR